MEFGMPTLLIRGENDNGVPIAEGFNIALTNVG